MHPATDSGPAGDGAEQAIACVTMLWKESLSNPVIEEQVLARTAALREAGLAASVLALADPEPVPDDLPDWVATESGGPRWPLALARRAGRAIDEAGRPQGVIICRSVLATLAADRARRRRDRQGWSVIYDCRGWYAAEHEHRGRFRLAGLAKTRLDRRALRRADAVAVVSPALLGIAVAGGAEPSRAHLIGPFSPLPAGAGAPQPPAQVVYVGNSVRKYQVDDLVLPILCEIADGLPETTIGWLDAAAGPEPEWLRENLWRRRVPREEVAAHLHGAHVGLIVREPTRTNIAAMPTKAGQYLAAGCRLVTSPSPPSVASLCQNADAGSIARNGEWAEKVQAELARPRPEPRHRDETIQLWRELIAEVTANRPSLRS